MENMIKQLDKYAEEALFYHDLPGLAISVEIGQHGPEHLKGLNYKRALGVKDVITQESLLPEQIFHMASVSKLFTSAGILKLCEQGELSLDSRICRLLPDVSVDDTRYEEITLFHMLTHTSGLADVEDYHWDDPQMDDQALRNYALSEEVKGSRMLWSPKENKFRYSNMAYELLGLVIAQTSGMSYEDYMKKHILEPLGMNDSTFLTFERAGGSLKLRDLSQADMAMPHTKNREKHIVLEKHYPYNRQHGPSSTLTSNIYDLAKWAKVHLNKQFFQAETYEKLWKRYTTVPNNGEGMGLGWFMRRQGEYDIYGHEGTDDGFRASFWICPALCAHVTVVSNISRGAVKKINKKIYDMLIHCE